jgi:hypothetical protein
MTTTPSVAWAASPGAHVHLHVLLEAPPEPPVQEEWLDAVERR